MHLLFLEKGGEERRGEERGGEGRWLAYFYSYDWPRYLFECDYKNASCFKYHNSKNVSSPVLCSVSCCLTLMPCMPCAEQGSTCWTCFPSATHIRKGLGCPENRMMLYTLSRTCFNQWWTYFKDTLVTNSQSWKKSLFERTLGILGILH